MGSYELSNLSEDMPPNITPESISEDASPDSTFFCTVLVMGHTILLTARTVLVTGHKILLTARTVLVTATHHHNQQNLNQKITMN